MWSTSLAKCLQIFLLDICYWENWTFRLVSTHTLVSVRFSHRYIVDVSPALAYDLCPAYPEMIIKNDFINQRVSQILDTEFPDFPCLLLTFLLLISNFRNTSKFVYFLTICCSQKKFPGLSWFLVWIPWPCRHPVNIKVQLKIVNKTIYARKWWFTELYHRTKL